MSKVKNYLSLIKFSHTIFAMPFALIGFCLGLKFYELNTSSIPAWNGKINWGWDVTAKVWWQEILGKFILVVLCMVFARSAAMAFNRYLDRNFDAKNPRTAIREIPSGIISANSALVFTVISSFLFIITCYFINRICFFLSPVALLVVLGYSYTKRFTPLCHLILGLGLSLAPIGAYLAVTGHFSLLPVLFSLSVIFWVSGFDIIYALQDEDFDKSQKLYSMPAWLGKSKALKVSEVLHVLSAACIIAAGILGRFGWLYWVGVLIFSCMLLYQHSIVKPHDLKKVNLAFMTANGIASVVFAAFVIADLLIHY
ncbi:MAG: 4-hydroxybenzoate octaprenyltransferase [Bacteroidetes bacterium]|nr:MAG: 4-hydroxybenzoate octaprenyltransferase [Bacteroidota bacterium]